MANHGQRAPRGSAYLDLPNTSVSDRAKEHHDLLTSTDTGPFYGKGFDHAGAAEDLEQLGAPAHIIQYHQDMANDEPSDQDFAVLKDKSDQMKHIREEE